MHYVSINPDQHINRLEQNCQSFLKLYQQFSRNGVKQLATAVNIFLGKERHFEKMEIFKVYTGQREYSLEQTQKTAWYNSQKNLIISFLEATINFTESVNQIMRRLQFAKQTRSIATPFESHHGENPRIESTKRIREFKSYISTLTKVNLRYNPNEFRFMKVRTRRET